MRGAFFSTGQFEVIRFCAIECELQASGERSVYNMLSAWNYAQDQPEKLPAEGHVLALGALVEPQRNSDGFRRCGVRVGWDVKPDWRMVPQQIHDLMRLVGDVEPAEFFRLFEEVHPFVDGNGRTGAILFNWIQGTLDHPTWPPNFWNDPRRVEGAGAGGLS